MNARTSPSRLSLFIGAMVLIASGAACSNALTLHASPNGDDSIAAALAEARRLKQDGAWPDGGVVVLLEPGRYELKQPIALTREHSGTADAPLVFRAAKPGTVIITGAVKVTGGKPVTDADVLGMLKESARSHVRQYDISGMQNGPLPGFTSGGAGFTGQRDYALQVYESGKRLPIARWPNDRHAQTGKMLGTSDGPKGREHYREGRFIFDSARLKQWAAEPDLWAHGRWYNHWADQRMKVKAIDVDKQEIEVADPKSHAYGFREGRDFYVFNAISELDQPGEWVIDRARQLLYVWPTGDADRPALELAVADTLVHGREVEHVRFEGLTFEMMRGDAMHFVKPGSVTVSGCTIRRTGGYGVQYLGGADSRVVHSDLYDLGEGGVVINGGNRRTLTPSNHHVENCHIYDLGNVIETYRPGVSVLGVGGVVRRNLIHDSPHTGLMFVGNNHLFEYNIVHDVCLHTSDAGGVYACARDWTKRGTVLQYNLVHWLGEALDNAGCRAIYLDDFTSGVTVRGNIVTSATVGIHVGGGRDNIVTNNLALNCRTPIEVASRGIDSFAAARARMGRESNIFKILENWPWDSPQWRQAYPRIGDVFKEDPVHAHDAMGNTVTNNIMAGSGPMVVSNRKFIEAATTLSHNESIPGDPGLADRAALDLRLSPDGPGRQAVPDFQPLPFEKMGLYNDPARPTPARKFGPQVTPLGPIDAAAFGAGSLPHAVVARVAPGKVKIDGVAAPKEWPTSPAASFTLGASMSPTNSKYTSRVTAAFGGESLLLCVAINTDPAAALVTEGKWGQRDAFEVALRDARGNDAPTFLVHCYPDGTTESVAVDMTTAEQATRFGKTLEYAAARREGGWTAELRIPLKANGITVDGLKVLQCNVNVRRMADQTWTAWHNGGAVWNVAQAGRLQFK